MILLHDFGIGIHECALNGKDNNFPVLDQCPGCGCLRQGNWVLGACHFPNFVESLTELGCGLMSRFRTS